MANDPLDSGISMPGSDRFNRKPALPQIIVATGAAARGPSVARQARLLRTGDDHFAVKPPSIIRIAPVKKLAKSLARYVKKAATSAGEAIRPIG